MYREKQQATDIRLLNQQNNSLKQGTTDWNEGSLALASLRLSQYLEPQGIQPIVSLTSLANDEHPGQKSCDRYGTM